MSDIIHLLPDSLANQIAAGEVIQRPASVVKELLENALDADSKSIQLIIKDSGKTLIQVVDDGKGMSDTDARMSFERHATSKISKSDDLFEIKSFGFRGEALASIAAIAFVELLTKTENAELGTQINIQGSKVVKQQPAQIAKGTSISVKNLFFNVPARRKFLKSDPVELKHILEEFSRIALPNPEVFFTVYHNDNELYHFPPTNLRQRITKYFGKTTNEHIVPVEELTDFVSIKGFVGKPELIKKSRGDQYIFVNRRFIKSNYLNHAVRMAYENLIPKDHYPFYFLMLDIDPSMIDVNIHPTKQEVKFENERLIYNYVKVAVKHSLGKYSITPSIDFESTELEMINQSNVEHNSPVAQQGRQHSEHLSKFKNRVPNNEDWLKFYDELSARVVDDHGESITLTSDWSSHKDDAQGSSHKCFQIHDSYIISAIKSGWMVIDQESAHERVLYEKNLSALQNDQQLAQTNLFPETIKFNPKHVEILESISSDISNAGIQLEKFSKDTYVIKATPVDGLKLSPKEFLNSFLDSYIQNLELQIDIQDNIARSMAQQTKIKKGKKLSEIEMRELIDKLFACKMPYLSPSGSKCFITFGLDELEEKFKNRN